MDDTQSYLNSILKKRLGSVVNYNSSSKTANTVSRIPKQQQKIQTMPTVFRKKHQTVYLQQPNKPTQYSQIHSQYLSIKQGSKPPQSIIGNNEMPQENRQSSNQRVQYMLISKRIQTKKEDQFISPTVDVTSYKIKNAQNLHQHQSNHNNNQPQRQFQSNIYTGSNSNNVNHVKSTEYLSQRPKNTLQDNNYEHAMASKISANTNQSKRKKIF